MNVPETGRVVEPDPAVQPHWELRLYVTGQAPKSTRAAETLQRVCEEHLPGRYSIEIVDLRQNPRLAAEDEILAVPTVVRKLPQPLRKLVGDLSDTNQLLVGLQLRPNEGGPDGRDRA